MSTIDDLRGVVRIAKAASGGIVGNTPRIERAEAAIADYCDLQAAAGRLAVERAEFRISHEKLTKAANELAAAWRQKSVSIMNGDMRVAYKACADELTAALAAQPAAPVAVDDDDRLLTALDVSWPSEDERAAATRVVTKDGIDVTYPSHWIKRLVAALAQPDGARMGGEA